MEKIEIKLNVKPQFANIFKMLETASNIDNAILVSGSLKAEEYDDYNDLSVIIRFPRNKDKQKTEK